MAPTTGGGVSGRCGGLSGHATSRRKKFRLPCHPEHRISLGRFSRRPDSELFPTPSPAHGAQWRGSWGSGEEPVWCKGGQRRSHSSLYPPRKPCRNQPTRFLVLHSASLRNEFLISARGHEEKVPQGNGNQNLDGRHSAPASYRRDPAVSSLLSLSLLICKMASWSSCCPGAVEKMSYSKTHLVQSV